MTKHKPILFRKLNFRNIHLFSLYQFRVENREKERERDRERERESWINEAIQAIIIAVEVSERKASKRQNGVSF